MLEKVKVFFEVLEAGKMLNNPAAWKNGQTAANSGIIAVLVALRTLVPPEYHLSDETLSNIGLIIGSVGSLVNIYLTMGTSEKVGFSSTCEKD